MGAFRMTKSLQQGRKESSLDLAPYKSNYKCRIWLLCLAGVLAVVVCTFSLTGDFVLDDWLVLGEHPIIRNKLPLWQLFFVDQWGNHLSGKVTTYRPLMPLIWWPIWQVSPNNPFVFRLLTLFLHLTATISIILVGNLFIKNKWIVALAAVFFAVFAVHAEVLGSIAHQNEILAFILCLWALYFIEKKYAPPLLSMLLLILAVLIKESAIVFYVVILLYLAARREIGKQILLVVSILLSAVLMIGIQLSLDRAPFIIGNMDNLSHDALGMERLLHGLYTIGKGVLLMLAPVGLAPFHGYASIDLSPVTLLPLAIIGGLALFLGCAVLLWGLWNKLA